MLLKEEWVEIAVNWTRQFLPFRKEERLRRGKARKEENEKKTQKEDEDFAKNVENRLQTEEDWSGYEPRTQ